MSRAASSATSGETAATAATSWPAKRTARDSVVQTAFTPGSFSALEVSILTISAAGTLARTMRPQSMPGRLTSNVYFARPVTLAGPSRRGWRPLTTRSFVSRSQGLMSPGAAWTSSVWGALGDPTFTRKVTVASGGLGVEEASCVISSLPCRGRRGLGRLEHGLEHARVGAAAAEVAGQAVLDLLEGRVRILLEQRGRGDHEAGSAEAALQGVRLHEGGLHGAHLLRRAEALDGRDLVADGVRGQHQAGGHGLAVQEHRAAAAGAAVADLLGPGEVEVVAQRAQERDPRLHRHRPRRAVDAQGEGDGLGAEDARSVRGGGRAHEAGGGGPHAGRLEERPSGDAPGVVVGRRVGHWRPRSAPPAPGAERGRKRRDSSPTRGGGSRARRLFPVASYVNHGTSTD